MTSAQPVSIPENIIPYSLMVKDILYLMIQKPIFVLFSLSKRPLQKRTGLLCKYQTIPSFLF
jgi:hypothetical protein